MIILDGTKEIEYAGNTLVCIGKFDGIHIGHQRLISEIINNPMGKSLVFTFKASSKAVIDANERILSEEERLSKFESLGVDYLVEFDLNDETKKMSPEDFLRVILKERLHAKLVVCGPDLSFGYKGQGNVKLMESMQDELDIKVKVIEKVKYQGEDISSTRIRDAIRNGEEHNAKVMLGTEK